MATIQQQQLLLCRTGFQLHHEPFQRHAGHGHALHVEVLGGQEHLSLLVLVGMRVEIHDELGLGPQSLEEIGHALLPAYLALVQEREDLFGGHVIAFHQHVAQHLQSASDVVKAGSVLSS